MAAARHSVQQTPGPDTEPAAVWAGHHGNTGTVVMALGNMVIFRLNVRYTAESRELKMDVELKIRYLTILC